MHKHIFEYERYNNELIRSCTERGCVFVQEALMTKECEPNDLIYGSRTNYNHPSIHWKTVGEKQMLTSTIKERTNNEEDLFPGLYMGKGTGNIYLFNKDKKGTLIFSNQNDPIGLSISCYTKDNYKPFFGTVEIKQ